MNLKNVFVNMFTAGTIGFSVYFILGFLMACCSLNNYEILPYLLNVFFKNSLRFGLMPGLIISFICELINLTKKDKNKIEFSGSKFVLVAVALSFLTYMDHLFDPSVPSERIIVVIIVMFMIFLKTQDFSKSINLFFGKIANLNREG